jgi:hypothetical protein
MIKKISNKTWIVLALIWVCCVSCNSEVNDALPLPLKPPEDVSLTLDVTASTQGEFKLKGDTNLPHNTRLTALALRYLEPSSPRSTDTPALYSILDYRTTKVQHNQWSATLDLWQVGEDGSYQEAWQNQEQQLNLNLQPDDAVQFVVTLDPEEFWRTLNRSAYQKALTFTNELLKITPDGDPLLWAAQALAVDLPQGSTVVPNDIALRQNGGWGERYLLVPEPPLPYTLVPDDVRRTNAPLSPAEQMQ